MARRRGVGDVDDHEVVHEGTVSPSRSRAVVVEGSACATEREDGYPPRWSRRAAIRGEPRKLVAAPAVLATVIDNTRALNPSETRVGRSRIGA
jgi:hypothetical protein